MKFEIDITFDGDVLRSSRLNRSKAPTLSFQSVPKSSKMDLAIKSYCDFELGSRIFVNFTNWALYHIGVFDLAFSKLRFDEPCLIYRDFLTWCDNAKVELRTGGDNCQRICLRSKLMLDYFTKVNFKLMWSRQVFSTLTYLECLDMVEMHSFCSNLLWLQCIQTFMYWSEHYFLKKN